MLFSKSSWQSYESTLVASYFCHISWTSFEKPLALIILKKQALSDLFYFIPCRYITVLYFLNDVEEGGETAFPVADNATFSIEVQNTKTPLLTLQTLANITVLLDQCHDGLVRTSMFVHSMS